MPLENNKGQVEGTTLDPSLVKDQVEGPDNPYIYEKVRLDHRVLAGFFLRFVAYILDLIVASSVRRLFSFFLVDYPTLQGLVATLAFLAYFILATGLTKGQTLGKMVLGLKVIRTNGQDLSWTDVLIREGACRYILKVVPILYLLTLFTDEKQHLGDLITDTYVIKEAYEEDLYYKQAYVYPNYKTSYIKAN